MKLLIAIGCLLLLLCGCMTLRIDKMTVSCGDNCTIQIDGSKRVVIPSSMTIPASLMGL